MVFAVQHALRVVEISENLAGEDEFPPDFVWAFESRLSSWLKEVKRRRESKFGGGGDSEPGLRNEYAERFGR